MKKCPSCEKGELIKVDNVIIEIENYVFVVKGERCSDCNEEFPFEDETQRIIETSKKLGVWPEPLKLYRQLTKSGRGLIFRVPADLERQLNLKEGEEIAVSKIGNKILVEPIKINQN